MSLGHAIGRLDEGRDGVGEGKHMYGALSTRGYVRVGNGVRGRCM